MIARSHTETESLDNLLAGSADIVTAHATLAAGENLVRGAVLGRVTSSGKLVWSDPAAADGSEAPVGILVHDTDASGADAPCQFYTGGAFHTDELTWHSGYASAEAKAAAFDATNITLR